VELTEDDIESALEALVDEVRGLMREISPVIERAVDAKYAGQSQARQIPPPDPR
jgi:hypothetical protein